MKRCYVVRVAIDSLTENWGIGFPNTQPEADKEATDSYRRWAETWVIPDLKDLIKELRDK